MVEAHPAAAVVHPAAAVVADHAAEAVATSQTPRSTEPAAEPNGLRRFHSIDTLLARMASAPASTGNGKTITEISCRNSSYSTLLTGKRYNKSSVSPLAQPEELVQINLSPRVPAPKPAWLKARAPMGETFHALKKLARDLNLHTVCESAHCPNIGECWNHKTATFMMLGNLCTRRCGFCAVPKGKPAPIDHTEPARVAFAVASLGLSHAVITSVNRDDDNLGAAQAFVNVIAEIRKQAPACRVEVLTPDFQGVPEARRMVVAARPEILNHNI